MDPTLDADLYRAVINGNTKEVKKLLDVGAAVNATTYNNNWSPLHLAAFLNRTDIIEILLKGNAKVNLVDTDGDTALHLTLLQNHLQAAEILKQHGASLQTKNRKGETPEDKGYDEMRRKKRNAVYWKNSVPTEIEQMKDEESVRLYLKLLESGSEKKRDIRLVVVGRKGAGKTSLIKKLFGENGKAAKTNGIEIHRLRCKSDSDDGMWTKLDRKEEELEINARLLKPYGQTLKKNEEESKKTMSSRPEEISLRFDEISNRTKLKTQDAAISTKKKDEEDILTINKDKEVNVGDHPLPDDEEEYDIFDSDIVENSQLSETADDSWLESNTVLRKKKARAHSDIESMLINSRVNIDDNEDYASVFLWDFAGDEEFYHTHQTFLSPDAIYLVVTQMNIADTEESQVMFRLWIDSIHCYCQMQQQKQTDNNTENGINDDKLDPPIVVVGTFKDQVKAFGGKQREKECNKKLEKLAELVPKDALRHIRDQYTHFLSNTKDDDTVFTLLRKEIMQIARTMKSWNQDYPLKFIQLERLLREKRTVLPIISFKEIQKIVTTIPEPLNDEELLLFLKFHHEIREIVYFEDIPEYIILDTQWLADGFKCIVTADDFQRKRLQNKDEWNDFNQKGKLSHAVIEDIYTNLKLFSQHKTHILKVMEKFNIIIHCNKSIDSQKPCYYVPCMIKRELKEDIHEMFEITDDRKSLWLCFAFTFLPPHLMNHLVASLHREYEFVEVFGEIALFKNMVVFDLDEKGLHKLLVASYANLIQIQIWKSGEGEGTYIDIVNKVTEELSNIVKIRFKLTNVTFEKKLKCSTATYDSTVGLTKLFGDGETYHCKMCNSTHNFNDDWSYPFRKQVIPLKIHKGKPTITQITKNCSVQMKSKVTLSCSVKAYPTCDLITWTKKKDGQQATIRDVMDTSSRYRGVNTENLTILSVDDSDSGEYICTARNIYGIGKSNPIILEIDKEIPDVYVDQTEHDVNFKSAFTLCCTIRAHPKVEQIKWIKLKDDREEMVSDTFQNSSKYRGSKTGHLTIIDVEDNDTGKYICAATNVQGTGRSKPISLTVIGGLQDIKKMIVSYEQKPTKEDLIRYKIEIQMDVWKDLKIGREVSFGRYNVGNNYAYKHHGIVTSICKASQTFEIVELTAKGTAGNFSMAISGSCLKPKIMKNSIHFQESHLFYYDYSSFSFSEEIIKERAEMLVRIFDKSGIDYKLYEFNCEHFTSYCATGVAFSRQLSDVNEKATQALDDTLVSYIDRRLNPDGSHMNNKTDGSKKDKCLVM